MLNSKEMMDREDLKSRAVQLLKAAVEATDRPRLPSMRMLSKQWGISRGVIARAAKVLRAEGILSYSSGRGMYVCANMPDRESVTEQNPQEVLRDRLYDGIASGALQRGQRLPKLDAICRDHHVSKTTVSRVLRELQSEQLVSKVGKGWFIGPPPSREIYSAPVTPTILLIEDNERSWVSAVQAERTVGFPLQFSREVQRFGIRQLSVFTGSHRTPVGAEYVGIDGVRKCIRDLGSAYLGTLIVSNPATNPDITQWVNTLVRYKKPVVWFDRYDMPLDFKLPSPLYTRCHFSEQAGIRACIDFLHSYGHRNIVYPFIDRSKSVWEWNRSRFLVEEGRKRGLRAVVHPLRPGSGKEDGSIDLLDCLLTRALNEPGVTAIVAPRDYTAVKYFYRLMHRGVKVPRDISLISFDNSAHAQPAGITSVDFGFNHLGYSAFHLILKDIPVARTRAQAVPGKANVVRRSTVEIVR